MADNTANYAVEQQKVQVCILEQQGAIARFKLEIMELIDRVLKNNVNIQATHAGIVNVGQEIAAASTPLEKQRKKSQLAALNANIERQTLENLEMAERVTASVTRADSAAKSLEQYFAAAKSLEEAHGLPPVNTITELAKECVELVEGLPVENEK